MSRHIVRDALLSCFSQLGFAAQEQPLAVGVEEELQTVLHEDPTQGEGALAMVRTLAEITDEQDLCYEGDLAVGINREGVIMTTDAGRRQIEFIYDPVVHLRDFAGVQATTRRLAVEVLKKEGYSVLGTGYHPWAKSTWDDWMPKQRYEALVEALNPAVLRSADTAGLQATVDTRSLDHMLKTANVFNLAAPVIAALTTNSPLHDGTFEVENKGLRHFTWNKLAPEQRRGVMHFGSIEEYLDWVLDLPVLMMLEKSGLATVPNPPICFWQWALPVLESGDIEEFKRRFNVHTACAWPEARIRPFNKVASVEGRTPCAQPSGAATSVVALYLGLAENVDGALEVLSQFTVPDLKAARTCCAKRGLQGVIDGCEVSIVATELLEAAKRGLEMRDLEEEGELDLLFIRASDRRTPADDLIELASSGGDLMAAITYAV